MVNQIDRALEQAQERAVHVTPETVQSILDDTRVSIDVDLAIMTHNTSQKKFPIGTRLRLCSGINTEVVEVVTHLMIPTDKRYIAHVKVRHTNGALEDIPYHDLIEQSSLVNE